MIYKCINERVIIFLSNSSHLTFHIFFSLGNPDLLTCVKWLAALSARRTLTFHIHYISNCIYLIFRFSFLKCFFHFSLLYDNLYSSILLYMILDFEFVHRARPMDGSI